MTNRLRLDAWAACVLLAAVLAMTPGVRADANAVPESRTRAVQEALEQLAARAQQQLEPLPAGRTRSLRAVVMQTKGTAQWRPDDESAWKKAAVDDILEAGAAIRTNSRSSMTLRVGPNATVRVNRLTRMRLPRIVQEGETLSTFIQVERGRAEFKVDKVGLTNDFSVLTPSTTLAVRGTGYSVEYGGFRGTEVSAARIDELFAIELRYFMSRFLYLVSAYGRSTETHPNPPIAQLFETLGPPRIINAQIEDPEAATSDLLSTGFERNPVYQEREVLNANQSTEATEETVDEIPPPEPPEPPEPPDPPDPPDPPMFPFDPIDRFTFGDIAEYICVNYDPYIMDVYEQLLVEIGAFEMMAFMDLFSVIGGICDTEEYTDETLIEIVDAVRSYCESQTEEVELCVSLFQDAFLEVWPEFVGLENYDFGQIAELICTDLDAIVSTFGVGLQGTFEGYNIESLAGFEDQMQALCASTEGVFDNQLLLDLMADVRSYCATESAVTDVELCVTIFEQSVVEHGPPP